MPTLETHPLSPGEGSPAMIAAGVIKLPYQLEAFLDADNPLLEPTVTLGSYTWEPHTGNRWNNGNATDSIYYPERGMFGDAVGLPNPGRAGILRMKHGVQQMTDLGIDTIVSVTNAPDEKAIDVLPKLAGLAAGLGSTAVEVNLSYSNGISKSGELEPPVCHNPELTAEVLDAVRAEVGSGVVLGVKDSPHILGVDGPVDGRAVRDFAIAASPYVDFVTGINAIGGQVFPEIDVTDGIGDMSGPAVAPYAHNWLNHVVPALPDNVAVLSCGGVETRNFADEAKLRQSMGALLVGGAQEFYRSPYPVRVANDWAKRYFSDNL